MDVEVVKLLFWTRFGAILAASTRIFTLFSLSKPAATYLPRLQGLQAQDLLQRVVDQLRRAVPLPLAARLPHVGLHAQAAAGHRVAEPLAAAPAVVQAPRARRYAAHGARRAQTLRLEDFRSRGRVINLNSH